MQRFQYIIGIGFVSEFKLFQPSARLIGLYIQAHMLILWKPCQKCPQLLQNHSTEPTKVHWLDWLVAFDRAQCVRGMHANTGER